MQLASGMLQVSGILAGISTSFTLSRISKHGQEVKKGILVMDTAQIRALRAYEIFRKFAISTLAFIISTLMSLLWILSIVISANLVICSTAIMSASFLALGLIIFMSIVRDFLRYELWLK